MQLPPPSDHPTVRLTTAQALVRWLAAQHTERDGVRRRAVPAIWGIFGHGNVVALGQALHQEGAELPLYQPKHEQSMVHAAIGFAKAARRTQLHACTASIGPGATNLLTGAATATVNRVPVLLLPADTFASRRSGVVLQQLEDPAAGDLTVNDAFRAVSRFFDRVARPEQLLTSLPAAMRVLLDPADTGAVTVALHQDVLGEAYDWPAEFFRERTWTIARRPPAAEELTAARAVIAAAERPLVIAGGGVRYSGAEEALAAFSAATGIPVAETSAGKGVMPAGPLNLGGIGVNGTAAARAIAEQADLVITCGTRLTDFTTASHSLFKHRHVRFLGINVAASDAYKLGATPLVADARLALEALTEAAAPAARPDVIAAQAAWATAREHQTNAFDRRAVYETVNASARPGDWVVGAAGWTPGDLLKLWRVPELGHAHLEFGFSCMGHELPAGLGIRLHEGPNGEVFVIVGDGSLLMAVPELLTAVQYELKTILIVIDNAGYGSIDALAKDTVGVSLGNRFVDAVGRELEVDVPAIAEAFGCAGVLVEDAEALTTALAAARAATRTTVIHCPVVDGEIPPSGAFWDLGVPETVADQPGRARAADALERRRASGQRTFV